MNIIGIYCITNLIDGKVYIGQTTDFDKRKKSHIRALNSNTHINKHLQNAWNKYGEQSFIFSLIELCDIESLTVREQYWIDFYGGINSKNVYNARDAGDSGDFSEETRQRISNSLKNHPVSEITRQKLREKSTGRKHTDEAKRKISESTKGCTHMVGRHLSEETKLKISNSLKGRTAHNKGVPCTEETKLKISKSLKGKPKQKWTAEQKRAQSERLKGRQPHNKGKVLETSHKVGQYTIDGECVNVYLSTTQVSKFGYNAGCVSQCCRGLRKTAHGYIWRYI